jgi:hypothetical protein
VQLFDYPRVAAEAGIPPERLQRLREMMDRDFPGDEMMSDLHVLRACMAVRDGMVSLDEVLRAGTVPLRTSDSLG